jgi:hypothetical protein
MSWQQASSSSSSSLSSSSKQSSSKRLALASHHEQDIAPPARRGGRFLFRTALLAVAFLVACSTSQVRKGSSYLNVIADAMSPNNGGDVFALTAAAAAAGCGRTTMQGGGTGAPANINKRRSRHQNEPNRSSFWIDNVGTSPLQMVVLSPREGMVTGMVMPVFRFVPMHIY